MKGIMVERADSSGAMPPEAYLVFDHPIAFHTANRVFAAEADRRDLTIVRFLWWHEFTTTRLFLENCSAAVRPCSLPSSSCHLRSMCISSMPAKDPSRNKFYDLRMILA
jgi:hypothetical protein